MTNIDPAIVEACAQPAGSKPTLAEAVTRLVDAARAEGEKQGIRKAIYEAGLWCGECDPASQDDDCCIVPPRIHAALKATPVTPREQDAHADLCRRLVTALNERDAARAEVARMREAVGCICLPDFCYGDKNTTCHACDALNPEADCLAALTEAAPE